MPRKNTLFVLLRGCQMLKITARNPNGSECLGRFPALDEGADRAGCSFAALEFQQHVT